MTRSLTRFAAGAGASVALLLAGGPGVAVTFADPGVRSGHASDRGAADRRPPGDHDRRHGPHDGISQDGRHGGRLVVPRASGRLPRFADTSDPAPGVVARGTVETSRSSAAVTVTVDVEAAVPDGPGTVVGGSSGGGTGSATRVAGPVVVPRVTIGNGHAITASSRTTVARPVPMPDVVLDESVVQAVPIVVPSPRLAPSPAPPPAAVAQQHLEISVVQAPVRSTWGPIAPRRPTGALFGLTGLILVPLAGAWLGYRQARAVKAARFATVAVATA